MQWASDRLNEKLPYAFNNELGWLRDHAPEYSIAVMIGAGPGVMAMALLEGNPDMDLRVIDINTCGYTQAHLQAEGLVAKYHVADSKVVGKLYQGRALDFLLVDGDHSKQGVIGDINEWWRHVRVGGYIFFHDVININDDKLNGVADALAHLKQEYLMQFVDNPGISEVYQKI